MLQVHIVISDRGWILERLAKEIASRYEYVTYSTTANPEAPIQYYMTYSTWKGRVSPFEISFFTHLEPQGKARERFFQVAKNTDYCVCMSRKYEEILRQHGIAHVTTISPGIDIDQFIPKIKIGVVGRTYRTGRKGENLIADVLDIPYIEWYFTGEGWPSPALNIPDEKMPDFYNSMDYILVPSLYEGGPMCVLEALACGKEVIAPPVGWVPQYPHIEFETGNSKDLRRVLEDLVKNRFELRSSVLDKTWQNWAKAHDRLFRKCYESLNQNKKDLDISFYQRNNLKTKKVALVTHGDEDRSRGGPSVRVPKTVENLKVQEIQAQYISTTSNFIPSELADNDIVHIFNVWPPDSALNVIKWAKRNKKYVVLSSIFLNLDENQIFSSKIIKIFEEETNPEKINKELAKLRFGETIELEQGKDRNFVEPRPGYFAKVKRMIKLADRVIFLSENEQKSLESIGAIPKASSIVNNPVDSSLFSNVDAELFSKTYNIRNYVLCVARIEPRKNQLMLVYALRELDIPIVLIGSCLGKRYLNLIKTHAGKNLKIIDGLPPNSQILASAYAGARVFALPSWSEGASLAALEAAAAGTNLVLSNRSSEQEYFSNYAQYCDPGNPDSIRETVERAYYSSNNLEKQEKQKSYIAQNFNWNLYAQKTIEVYQAVLKEQKISSPGSNEGIKFCEPDTIYIDLTTSANHSGRWSGISRLEFMLAKSLFDLVPHNIRFIVWNSLSGYYFEVPSPEKISLETLNLVARNSVEVFPDFISQVRFGQNSTIFMMGSSWMQNQNYVYSLLHICKNNQVRLAFVIADIIPIKFPEWMPPGYSSRFLKHLKLLLKYSDLLFAISKHTKKDVLEFARKHNISIVDVSVFRLGDTIQENRDLFTKSNEKQEGKHLPDFLKPKQFILNVGAIHYRKNPHLLYTVWKRLEHELGYEKLPELVIVGGFSWNSDDFAQLLEASNLKDKILVLEGINDEELSWLYRNCMFTVYPSLYEGWGLPVAESLYYRKFCIASNISSIPEIAPDLTTLIDPLDTMEWYKTIKFYICNQKALQSVEEKIRDRYVPTTWSDTAAQVKSLLKYPNKIDGEKYEYFLGEMLNFAHPYNVLRYQTKGWLKTERWGGAWTDGYVASLTFQINELPHDFIRLQFLCAAFVVKPQHPHVFVHIYANGKFLKTWNFYDDRFREYYVDIPVTIFDSSCLLNISFHIFEPASPQDITGNGDSRMLGLKASKMRLVDPKYHRKPLCEHYPDVPTKASYIFGSTLKIDTNKEAEEIFVDSYNKDNNWGYFTEGHLTKLVLFPDQQPEEDIELQLALRPVATGEYPLNCLIIINKCFVGRLRATNSKLATYSIVIPQKIFRLMLPVVVEFQSETVNSPMELNIDGNHKQFLLGISSISLRKNSMERETDVYVSDFKQDNPYQLGQILDFTHYSQMRPILNPEWHNYEPDGVWSSQGKASIVLNLDRIPSTDVSLLMMVELPCGSDFSQVKVAVNENLLDNSVFSSHGINWLCCNISRTLVQTLQLKISLTAPLVSKCEVGRNGENPMVRHVGIKLSKIILQEFST